MGFQNDPLLAPLGYDFRSRICLVNLIYVIYATTNPFRGSSSEFMTVRLQPGKALRGLRSDATGTQPFPQPSSCNVIQTDWETPTSPCPDLAPCSKLTRSTKPNVFGCALLHRCTVLTRLKIISPITHIPVLYKILQADVTFCGAKVFCGLWGGWEWRFHFDSAY